MHPNGKENVCEPLTQLNIMVATGSNSSYLDDIEVIDMKTMTSCPNIPMKYPFGSYRAIAMKHDNKMVICGGGHTITSDCYSYSNDRWDVEAFKLEPARWGAMSVEIRPEEWLIMGGSDGTNIINDTKLLKNGIFTQGPDLPEPIYGGSSVMLNQTAASTGSGDSPRNYLLEINTDQWTQIANRTLTPSAYHSSGTFWNLTADEIQIANIGYRGIEVYSPREDSWHQLSFPYPLTRLYRSASIQQGTDSFILIGGQTNGDNYSSDIYVFDQNGFSIIKENVLRVPRDGHVAMQISNIGFTCH